MTKIAYNATYGGFGLGPKGVRRYAELAGLSLAPFVHAKKIGGGIDLYNYIPASTEEEAKDFFVFWRDPEGKSFHARDLKRTDPLLIQVIEELGVDANGKCSNLAIAEVPSGSKYRIDEYDGYETVMKPEDYEWETA